MISKKKAMISRVPNFAKYYVTNVKGGLTNHDFRFELLNERIGNKKDWSYVSDALVILSPIGAKRLLSLLKEMVDVYEKEKGKIDTQIPERLYTITED